MSTAFGGNDEIVNSAAVYTELNVGTTAVEVRVGGANLKGRQLVHMLPKDNEVYWGYDNTVTITTGTRVFKNQLVTIPIGDELSIWLIANGPDKKVNIAELA